MNTIKTIIITLCIITTGIIPQIVKANHEIKYQGRIQDTLGNYGEGTFDIRFSLWRNANTQAGDIASGIINTLAPDYLAWNETHTVTIAEKDRGMFVSYLGSINPIDINIFSDEPNIFLHIDIKSNENPESSYEQIDISSKPTQNRRELNKSPYALNAGKVGNREVGMGANNIPYTDGTGKLPDTIIPNGVSDNIFTLDRDGNANPTDTLSLQFGNTIGKLISWNGLLNQFEFNDSVSITGDLVVSGTINSVSVGEKSKKEILSPHYPNTVFLADGSDNKGSMYEDSEDNAGINYQTIQWSTQQVTIQDYDMQIHYNLPEDFIRFESNNQIEVLYKTEGLLTDSKLDIVLEKSDEIGTDQINGNGLNLSHNGWITQIFTLEPSTTWDNDDTLVFKVKMNATQNNIAHISNISIRYIGQ